MMRKNLLLALVAALPLASWAQAPAAATGSQAKKDLVAKVLQLQQPGIEAFSRDIVQRNVMQVMQQAANALPQRVAADKREAVWKEIQADAQKFATDAFPVVRDRAVKLAPGTIGAVLDERFSEDELRQLVAILESPVNRKFQSAAGDMQRVLGEKLMNEVRADVGPRMRTFEESVARKLGVKPPSNSASGAPK